MMKIDIVDIKEKLKLLSKVTSTIKTETLGGILFDGKSLTAFNGVIKLTVKLDVDCDDKFVLPDKAVKLIENLSIGYVDIEGKDNIVTVKYGKNKSKFATIPVAEFVNLAEEERTNEVVFNGEELQTAFKSVNYACTDLTDTKAIYNGVKIQDNETYGCSFTALDGFRLANYGMKNCKDKFNTCIVPKETTALINNIPTSEQVHMFNAKSGKFVTFVIGDYTIVSKLYEGEFMDLSRVMPATEIEVTANRNELISAIARHHIVCDDKSPIVITLEKDSGWLKFSGVGATAEFDEAVSLDKYAESDLTIGFTSKYLLDALKSFSDDNVTFKLKNAVSGMIIENGTQTALVLPVRLKK